jgi:hypothetical protein
MPELFTAFRGDHHEVCQILSGSVVINPEDGSLVIVGAGGFVVMQADWKSAWEVHEAVRKSDAIFSGVSNTHWRKVQPGRAARCNGGPAATSKTKEFPSYRLRNSSARTSNTPPTISTPPNSWIPAGSSPSNSQAHSTAKSTSVSEMKEASFDPSARAAMIPVT